MSGDGPTPDNRSDAKEEQKPPPTPVPRKRAELQKLRESEQHGDHKEKD